MPLPVFVGMRNWHPFLADTLAEMSAAGSAARSGSSPRLHRSYSSCLQYRENVRDARAALCEKGLPDVDIVYVDDRYPHPGFIEASARKPSARWRGWSRRCGSRPADLHRPQHPRQHGRRYPYQQQDQETARLIAETVARAAGRRSRT